MYVLASIANSYPYAELYVRSVYSELVIEFPIHNYSVLYSCVTRATTNIQKGLY